MKASPEDIHRDVSESLGLPVNPHDVPKNVAAGNAAAFELLNRLAAARKAQIGSEQVAEHDYAWTIHRAAAGVVAQVGVCDTLGGR